MDLTTLLDDYYELADEKSQLQNSYGNIIDQYDEVKRGMNALKKQIKQLVMETNYGPDAFENVEVETKQITIEDKYTVTSKKRKIVPISEEELKSYIDDDEAREEYLNKITKFVPSVYFKKI